MNQGSSSATWTGLIAIGAAVVMLTSIVSVLLGATFDDDDAMAKRLRSMHNLRQLGMANAMYAADWVDNQYTPLPHNFATLGGTMDEAVDALIALRERRERTFAIKLTDEDTLLLDNAERRRWLWPVSFDERPVGWFRMTNLLHSYVNGDFHDPVFYAPNDTIPLAELAKRQEGDAPRPFDRDPNTIVWSSYAWSPAGLYSPHVLSHQWIRDNGFQDPFATPGSFRVPTFSQVRYPDLKTHIIEHHWLQNAPENPVNLAFGKSRYTAPAPAPGVDPPANAGEPYYFNHGRRSVPNVVFYDGHVSKYSMDDVSGADARLRALNAGNDPGGPGAALGLWIRNPGGAANGYYENMAVDDLRASPHIFTADGIIGRDTTHE